MKKSALIIALAFALSACQVLKPLPPTATPVPPTPTPLPPRELTVCLGSEPESLYPYRANSADAKLVMQAIFDGPIDTLNGEPAAVMLEKIPNLADGSAWFTPVGVAAGDVVINTAGYLVSMQAGVQVFPAGCTSPACALTWDGVVPIQMDQLTATYKLRSGLTWSDGQPLKASDSVYSFNIASDPATPVDKHNSDLTAAYTATDDLTVQWVSKPGLADDHFEKFFWAPFPEHAWGGFSAGELLEAEKVNFAPIGWGAYVIDAWTKGESLRLVKNSAYFRAGEGLPYFEILNFKFIGPLGGQADLQLIKDGCDIVADSALDIASIGALKDILEGSGFKLTTYTSSRLEMAAFGINPVSYDDGYYPFGGDRQDLFGDPRTRQAIAACIDRQAIAAEMVKGLTGVSDSWLPASAALPAGAALNKNPFDTAAAIALLEAAGWRDLDQNPQTPRMHGGSARVAFGTPLEFTLLSSTAGLQAEIAGKIAADLAACGIRVNPASMTPDELYKPAPDGMVFGRKFDMVLLPWDTGLQFNCEFFEAKEIPKAANYWLGEVTGGANFYGYLNPAFDSECERMKATGLDSAAYQQAGSGLLQALSNDLPYIPLFHFPEGYLVRDDLCVFGENLNESALFAAIESLKDDGGC